MLFLNLKHEPKGSWPQGSKYVVMDSYCKACIFSKSGWWPSHLGAKRKKLLTLNRVSLFFFLNFCLFFLFVRCWNKKWASEMPVGGAGSPGCEAHLPPKEFQFQKSDSAFVSVSCWENVNGEENLATPHLKDGTLRFLRVSGPSDRSYRLNKMVPGQS